MNYYLICSGKPAKLDFEEHYAEDLLVEIRVPDGVDKRKWYYDKVKEFLKHEKLSLTDKHDILSAIYQHDVKLRDSFNTEYNSIV